MRKVFECAFSLEQPYCDLAGLSIVVCMQKVLCNDCGATGEAQFHFVYHKCMRCASYNTRILS